MDEGQGKGERRNKRGRIILLVNFLKLLNRSESLFAELNVHFCKHSCCSHSVFIKVNVPEKESCK